MLDALRIWHVPNCRALTQPLPRDSTACRDCPPYRLVMVGRDHRARRRHDGIAKNLRTARRSVPTFENGPKRRNYRRRRLRVYVRYRFCRARLPHGDFRERNGPQTTSGAAAAIWFPYHVEPAERVIPLALESYQVLLDLARFPESGVSIIESRQFLRTGEIEIPDWAIPLGASAIPSEVVRTARDRDSAVATALTVVSRCASR